MNESKETIYFPDDSFPIAIGKNRYSTVNDKWTALQAIHEAIEIKYFYEGTSTLLIGDNTVYAEVGDIIVINPYEFHTTVDCGGDARGRYVLLMIGLDFFEGVRGIDFDLRHLIFAKHTVFKTKISNNEKLQKLISTAANELDYGSQAARLSVFGLISQLFAELMRCGIEKGEKSSPAEDIIHYYSVIEPALRMMRDAYSNHFTVDMLADACLISKYHFCRIFKSVMGMTAIQYLNNYRLKIADAMLSSSDKQIGEIAAACGFQDAGYFSKIYKKHFGIPPKKQRKDK